MTQVQTTQFTNIDVATSTGVSTSAAATVSAQTGVITTEALSTAAGSTYTMTLTNTLITASSIVLVTVGKGTATAGEPVVQFVTPAAGTCVILIRNVAAAAALNGTIKIGFAVLNLA